MYDPAEDSELLAAAVTRYARGRTLDVGTGSGVLAYAAAEKGCDVLAVDIDRQSLASLKNAPFSTKYSDKLAAVSGKFDTIVCNPPYLPQDKEVSDSALHGGKKGYEYIVDVIRQAKHRLTADGSLLFIISTLTKPAVVENTLREEGYAWNIVLRKRLFMEELLVYSATLILGQPATLIGRGKRSVVYGTGRYAVKLSTPERAAKEAQMLKKVNKLRIGPKYVRHEGNRLYMQRILGEPFNKYIARTNDLRAMRQLLSQARILDKARIKKQELARPGTNVLVTKAGTVVLLDFERSIFTEKPNNVTQAATYMSRVLAKDSAAVLKQYKRSYSDDAYTALADHLFS